MARTALTALSAAVTGLNLTDNLTAAIADGHKFANPLGKTMFYAYNSSGGSITVTIQTPQTVEGLAVAENAVAIAAGKSYLFDGLKRSTFNQSDGTVYVDYSAHADLSVAAINPV